MKTNDKKDDQKPEVYKIVTLGQGNMDRREFVKGVAIATGAAVVAMGSNESKAKGTNDVSGAVSLLLNGDGGCPKHKGPDPCSTGCQCHIVCACEDVGTCNCDTVQSTCNPSVTGISETYDLVQQYTGSTCICNRVSVCTCDTVCTCDLMCTCQSVCSCVGNHYWYPC